MCTWRVPTSLRRKLRANDREPTNDIRLEWTPATLDLDGQPVDLMHYLVFAADAPVPKTDVVDGVAMPFMTVSGTSVELTPAVQSRFYSVFVVDIRGNISPD